MTKSIKAFLHNHFISVSLKGLSLWRHLFKGVNYGFEVFKKSAKPWFIIWTPTYHEGRGPYITFGFWKYGFYRGY